MCQNVLKKSRLTKTGRIYKIIGLGDTRQQYLIAEAPCNQTDRPQLYLGQLKTSAARYFRKIGIIFMKNFGMLSKRFEPTTIFVAYPFTYMQSY